MEDEEDVCTMWMNVKQLTTKLQRSHWERVVKQKCRWGKREYIKSTDGSEKQKWQQGKENKRRYTES